MKKIRSKYQQKNYEERTYTLDEYSCKKCDGVFTLDIDKCELKYVSDQARPYSIYYCPYCGTKHMIML